MLTVLIATRNRAPILHEVLKSYCRLQQPAGGWKLVVVDNGSTDETAQISSFADRIPMQYVLEVKVGKSHALNAGCDLLEGDLAVFADDDIFPYPDWLVLLRKAADTELAYLMFGGAIVPRWEVPPPSWVRYVELGPVYGVTDSSLKEGPVEAGLLFGGNLAIRSHVFQSGARFNPAMGPRGANYPMGSETEFALRLSRQGQRAWHVSGAVVEHFIRKEQLRMGWVFQRAALLGRGQYRLFPQAGSDTRLIMGTPRYLVIQIFRKAARVIVDLVLLKREAFFRALWRFNFVRGQVIEARVLERERLARVEPVPRFRKP